MIVTKMWRRIGGGGNGVRNAEVSVGGTDFNGLTVNCQSSIHYTPYTTSI
jgi:hypothetical protein